MEYDNLLVGEGADFARGMGEGTDLFGYVQGELGCPRFQYQGL